MHAAVCMTGLYVQDCIDMQMALGAWLIVKGFSSSAVAELSK
jgi:hypothetical protein